MTFALRPIACLLALPFTSLSGCRVDPCSNKIVATVPSPDGRRRAIVFQRDCGATTGFSTQVSVLDIKQALSGGGNVFAADTDHGRASSAQWGGPAVSAQWLDRSRLVVTYDHMARVYRQETRVRSIDIEFETLRDPPSP